MTNTTRTLETVLGIQGFALMLAISRKIGSPSLAGLNNPERALRFIRSNLRGSYLFARFVVPSYASGVFGSLTKFPPVDDKLGKLISTINDVVRGELLNNNVFSRPGECHAHYHDALEAYEAAGGDMLEVEDFHKLALESNSASALTLSSFWSLGSLRYAESLLECCDHRLATFIMMAVNEELAPGIYARVLATLSREPRFDKFRQFIERHVEFDSGGHGPATLEWLEYYIKSAHVSPDEIIFASDMVMKALSPSAHQQGG